MNLIGQRFQQREHYEHKTDATNHMRTHTHYTAFEQIYVISSASRAENERVKWGNHLPVPGSATRRQQK